MYPLQVNYFSQLFPVVLYVQSCKVSLDNVKQNIIVIYVANNIKYEHIIFSLLMLLSVRWVLSLDKIEEI